MKKRIISLFSLVMFLSVGLLCNVGAQIDSGDNNPDIKGQSNNIYFVNSPGSWDDGYSFGFGYEYQNKIVYIGPELYWFPGLANRENNPNVQGFDYFHIMTRIGLNKEWGKPKNTKWRLYAGTRLGLIYRETGGMSYANLGGEVGIQISLPFGLFGAIGLSRDIRTDSKLWSNNDSQTVNSLWTRIGIRF